MFQTDPRLLLLSPLDNVLVLREPVPAGQVLMVEGVPCATDFAVPLGHKLARRSIEQGEKIIKYGAPIGSATADIETGAHVHVHNVRSDYTPSQTLDLARASSGEKL